ncbi:MAG: transcription termination/antitermination protein NusG [Prevotellaceae bacterium]|jgi:transcriptional antiterminator NusG|nr:transcription termination/antitermination protein NusG [Prevotellaceae bacterium]
MAEAARKWYVLRAISGKESKVKEYIDIEVENNPGSDVARCVHQVVIPTEKIYVVKNGKKVIKERTFLPGYVLIEATLTKEMAGHLRNVPNVLGFLGVSKPGVYVPTPLRPNEVNKLLGTVDEIEEKTEEILVPFIIGERVKVMAGPFSGFSGSIEEVNNEKKRLKVMVTIFGRKNPVEIGFMQVEKE